MTLRAAYSTAIAADVAAAVEADYDTGRIAFAALHNRGFNDIYDLRGADGRRYMGRLNGRRFRGPHNLAYETALLAHLSAAGVAVAAAIPGKDGRLWREYEAPEGRRGFTLFHHITGRAPVRTVYLTGKLQSETLSDISVLGAGLATIHNAGGDYAGPPSRYRIDADHLVVRPLAQLMSLVALDDEQRIAIAATAETVIEQLDEAAPLSLAPCHGDNHGGNTFMSDGPDGRRVATWFDFDDGGPGFLAYDLATLYWGMLRRTRAAALDDVSGPVWQAFLEGYRTRRLLAEADLAAVRALVRARQVWFLGEYASRVGEWGLENVSRDWAASEFALLEMWKDLVTPAA